MASITIDESRWPVVHVRFEGTATDAEFDEYLARMSALLSRGQTIGVVLDASRSGTTPPVQRR